MNKFFLGLLILLSLQTFASDGCHYSIIKNQDTLDYVGQNYKVWPIANVVDGVQGKDYWFVCAYHMTEKITTDMVLEVGRVYDVDEAWFNKKLIGSTFQEISSGTWPFFIYRKYFISSQELGAISNELVVIFKLRSISLGKVGFIDGKPTFTPFWINKLPSILDILPVLAVLLVLVFFMFYRFKNEAVIGSKKLFFILSILTLLVVFFNSFYLYKTFFKYSLLWLKIHFAVTAFTISFISMFISKLVNRDYYNRANLIYATLFSIIVAAMPGIHPEEVNAKRLLVAFGIWGIPVIVYGFYFSVKFLMMSKEKFHIPIIIGGFSLIFLGGFDILQLLQGKLIYQISYSGIGFLLFLVFAFLALILKDHQNEIDKVLFDLKIHQATSQLAKQVSHDIRSPLAALKMALDEVENIPEEHRALIRSSVSRINDIANQLLEKGKQVKNDISLTIPRTSEMELTPQLLSPIIETLVSEKRVQFRDKQEIHIEAKVAKGYGLFANLNASEFKRVLSNLINNSCEAFTHPSGKVDVTLMSDAKNIIITIQDNGKGIPQHILKKLGEKGVSYGKEGTQSGSGLGVYHAKKTVESFGGKFEIISTEGQGTTIQMTFDRAPAPKWFEEKLSLLPSMQIISLDDDLSIHQIWKRRFESLKVIDFNIVHFTFTSGDEFREFVKKQNNTNQLYLVDYELLNQNATGLNLIEELNLGPQSILITSRYEEHQIRERCDTLGVKLIPKSMAASVPIEISKVKIKYDIILLDDDQLTRMTWEMRAKQKGKTILSLATASELWAKIHELDIENSFYLDVHLSQNESGVEISKELFNLGFKNLYLTTGYESDQFSHVTWIKGVVGKTPVV